MAQLVGVVMLRIELVSEINREYFIDKNFFRNDWVVSKVPELIKLSGRGVSVNKFGKVQSLGLPEAQELRVGPLPSVRRLPLYLQVLKALRNSGKDQVSCTHISDALNLDPTQVRKDLAITGIVGRPKVGYATGQLILAIETFLGWNNTSDAFLVGVGSLGTALLGYGGFADAGLNIIAAFDTDKEKIGKKVHGKPVFPIARLPNLVERMHVHIGVVTVPADAAKEVARTMVEAGILAIWNFANTQLNVPANIIVERAELTSSLAALTSRLRATLEN